MKNGAEAAIQALVLSGLRASRQAYDEAPDWRSVLALYDGQDQVTAAALDRALLAMIDEDYRNPVAATAMETGSTDPFESVLTGLPGGANPEDLLCIEAAVLVAAERGLGEALFRFNRLMRSPRWHAFFPRLQWLHQEGFAAQRRLAQTEAGRLLGALLGIALAELLVVDSAGVLTVTPGGGPLTWVDDCPAEDPVAPLLGACAGRPAGPPGTALDRLIGAPADAELARATPAEWEESMPSVLNEMSRTERLFRGARLGARFGPHSLPRRWSIGLPDRDRLDSLAESLYARRTVIRPRDAHIGGN